MGGYLATYHKYEVTDYYGSEYQKGTLEISVDVDGKLTWKLTMNNGINGSSDGKGRAVGLYLDIDENQIYNSYTEYTDRNSAAWNTFPTGNGTSASGYFTVGKSSFSVVLGISCMQKKVSVNGTTDYFTFYRDYWDNITNGIPPVIQDNGDNTFNIIGYKGNSVHNNNITKAQLEWTVESWSNQNQFGWLVYNGNYIRTDFGAYETEKKLENLSFSDIDRLYGGSYSTSKATRSVAATVINYGDKGDVTSNSYVYGYIKQYFPPSAPVEPELTSASYRNDRLTIKNNWTFTWGAATQANASSSVKGYRIRLFRVRTSSNGPTQHHTIPILDSQGNVVSSGDTDIYYDTGSENTVFTVDPVAYGFVPGDLVRLEVQAYSFNGQGEQLLSAIVASPNYGVVNAGIVHIKVNDEWKEGQVYVYEGAWKEASTVYVSDNNEWKEST